MPRTNRLLVRNVATKYAIVHVRESSPMRAVLTAAQGECPAVTRNDLYNAVRAFKMAGNLEMVADSVLPEALEGQSPAVQSPSVQSPAVITMSVEDATQAVQDKKMGIRAAAIACGLSKGTFYNRLHGLHGGPRGAPNKCGHPFVQHLADYIDALRTTFKMHVFTFQVQQYAQCMIEGMLFSPHPNSNPNPNPRDRFRSKV